MRPGVDSHRRRAWRARLRRRTRIKVAISCCARGPREDGTPERTRTSKGFPPQAPQACVSTNSTTGAERARTSRPVRPRGKDGTGRAFRSGESVRQGLARESQDLAELHFESSADILATEDQSDPRVGDRGDEDADAGFGDGGRDLGDSTEGDLERYGTRWLRTGYWVFFRN